MQLKLDRSEFEERGFFSKKTKYLVNAALLVSPEEEAKIKQLGFWKKKVRPLARAEEGDYDLEVMSLNTFGNLVEGFKISGDLPFIEEMEGVIVAACKDLRRHMEGGQAGERIIDI